MFHTNNEYEFTKRSTLSDRGKFFLLAANPKTQYHGCHFYFLKIRYMRIDQSEIPLRVWKIRIWLNIHLKYHIFMCFQPFWREIIQRNSACGGLCADWQYDRSAKILNNPLQPLQRFLRKTTLIQNDTYASIKIVLNTISVYVAHFSYKTEWKYHKMLSYVWNTYHTMSISLVNAY